MPTTNQNGLGTKQGKEEAAKLLKATRILKAEVQKAVSQYGGRRIFRAIAEVDDFRNPTRKNYMVNFQEKLQNRGFFVHPIPNLHNHQGVFRQFHPVEIEKVVLADASLMNAAPREEVLQRRHQRILGDIYGIWVVLHDIADYVFDTQIEYEHFLNGLNPKEQEALLLAGHAIADLLSAPEALLVPMLSNALYTHAEVLELEKAQLGGPKVELTPEQLAAVARYLGIRFNMRFVDIIRRLDSLDLIVVKDVKD